MNIVIWARVSSREQREGYSIDAQLRFCRAKAQRDGWTVVKEFAVAESAKRGAERLVFNEMYDWVRRNARKEKIGGILSHKLDRVCRNIRDAVRMQELEDLCGVKLAFVDNEFGPGAAGALSFNVMAAVAQYYSDNLRTEVLKGRNEKAEQGWLPATAPYGYANVRDREAPIQPHPAEAKAVVRIFELYARGDTTFRLLADQLAREGHVYKPSQPRFTPTTISYILNNRFYIGQFRWQQKEWRPGRHRTLIDTGTFQRCQQLLGKKNHRLAKPDLPLAYGLFRCEHCGSLITGERIKRKLRGGGVREHLYYRCANNNPGPDHPVVRWRAEELDEAIAEDLTTMRLPNTEIAAWFSQTLRQAFADEANQRNRQQTILVRRRSELASTKDRLVRAFVSSAIDETTLKAQSVTLDAELAEVNRSLEACGDIDAGRGDIAVRLFDWTQNAAEDWRGSKIARKRVVLEALSLNRRLSATSLYLEKRRPFRELSERPSIQLNRGGRIRTDDFLHPNEPKHDKGDERSFRKTMLNQLLRAIVENSNRVEESPQVVQIRPEMSCSTGFPSLQLATTNMKGWRFCRASTGGYHGLLSALMVDAMIGKSFFRQAVRTLALRLLGLSILVCALWPPLSVYAPVTFLPEHVINPIPGVPNPVRGPSWQVRDRNGGKHITGTCVVPGCNREYSWWLKYGTYTFGTSEKPRPCAIHELMPAPWDLWLNAIVFILDFKQTLWFPLVANAVLLLAALFGSLMLFARRPPAIFDHLRESEGTEGPKAPSSLSETSYKIVAGKDSRFTIKIPCVGWAVVPAAEMSPDRKSRATPVLRVEAPRARADLVMYECTWEDKNSTDRREGVAEAAGALAKISPASLKFVPAAFGDAQGLVAEYRTSKALYAYGAIAFVPTDDGFYLLVGEASHESSREVASLVIRSFRVGAESAVAVAAANGHNEKMDQLHKLLVAAKGSQELGCLLGTPLAVIVFVLVLYGVWHRCNAWLGLLAGLGSVHCGWAATEMALAPFEQRRLRQTMNEAFAVARGLGMSEVDVLRVIENNYPNHL